MDGVSPAHEAQERRTQGSRASLSMAATDVTPATPYSLLSRCPLVSSSLCVYAYISHSTASRLFLLLLFFL